MRGQAFEVFRLLIAAVVAGAILMVLLGILGGLTTPTQDPQKVAAQLVKNKSEYGGKAVSDPITFKKGTSIYLPAVAAEAALGEDCVKGEVDSTLSNRFRAQGKYIDYLGNVNFTARIEVECTTGGRSGCPVECTVKIVPK